MYEIVGNATNMRQQIGIMKRGLGRHQTSFYKRD